MKWKSSKYQPWNGRDIRKKFAFFPKEVTGTSGFYKVWLRFYYKAYKWTKGLNELYRGGYKGGEKLTTNYYEDTEVVEGRWSFVASFECRVNALGDKRISLKYEPLDEKTPLTEPTGETPNFIPSMAPSMAFVRATGEILNSPITCNK